MRHELKLLRRFRLAGCHNTKLDFPPLIS
jgi:hypothetical protein